MNNIFVSIPCYRDPEIKLTLIDCYNRAKNPRNIIVGINYQHKLGEDFDLEGFLNNFEYKNQVKVIYQDYTKAKGPVWARHQIYNKLVKDEKYYLQIDAHSRFSEHWDEKLIKLLHECPNPYDSVLSNYPLGYDDKDVYVNEIYFKKMRDDIPIFGSTRIEGVIEKNKRNNFWAAGNSFSTTQIFARVPIDPHYKNLFWGEEFVTALRFYTHGIDVFTPRLNIIRTQWARGGRNVFWELKGHHKDFELITMASKERLKQICHLIKDKWKLKDAHLYGLGNKRDYNNFFKKPE